MKLGRLLAIGTLSATPFFSSACATRPPELATESYTTAPGEAENPIENNILEDAPESQILEAPAGCMVMGGSLGVEEQIVCPILSKNPELNQ